MSIIKLNYKYSTTLKIMWRFKQNEYFAEHFQIEFFSVIFQPYTLF